MNASYHLSQTNLYEMEDQSFDVKVVKALQNIHLAINDVSNRLTALESTRVCASGAEAAPFSRRLGPV
jgi:hypothetical protein